MARTSAMPLAVDVTTRSAAPGFFHLSKVAINPVGQPIYFLAER
jgi:hypothetical protein